MSDTTLLSPWVRRFLLEHLTRDRNLSPNTQKSYRDMLMQLLPFLATPERFKGRRPQPPRLPTAAWINPPQPKESVEPQTTRPCAVN